MECVRVLAALASHYSCGFCSTKASRTLTKYPILHANTDLFASGSYGTTKDRGSLLCSELMGYPVGRNQNTWRAGIVSHARSVLFARYLRDDPLVPPITGDMAGGASRVRDESMDDPGRLTQ